jgi:hypothetical protein
MRDYDQEIERKAHPENFAKPDDDEDNEEDDDEETE